MKTLKYLQIIAGVGLVVAATGCVHERTTYVTQVPPAQPVSPPPPAEAQPPPAPAPIIRSSVELDRMLAPIALYPDPLTAQILPAATVPDQVADADAYVRQGRDLNRVDDEPWDQSVQALTRYPDVLRMMAGNLPWTSDLGIAFVNQGQDVMDSIQRLRAQARAVGTLQTTPEQIVIVEDRIIQIVPANPQVIYVPVYRPELVYVRPPAGFHIVFSVGRPIGPWLNHDVNWRDRDVIVWHRDHPRPQNWWYEPPSRHERPLVVNNNTTVVNNYAVWQPRDRRNNAQANRNTGHDLARDGSRPLNNSGAPPSGTGNGNPRTISAPKDPQRHLPPVARGPQVSDNRITSGRDIRPTPLPAPPVAARNVPPPTQPKPGPLLPDKPAPGQPVVSTPVGSRLPARSIKTPPTNAHATLPDRDSRTPVNVNAKPGTSTPRPIPAERAPVVRGKDAPTNARPASNANSAEKSHGRPEPKADKKGQASKSRPNGTNSLPANEVDRPR